MTLLLRQLQDASIIMMNIIKLTLLRCFTETKWILTLSGEQQTNRKQQI